MIHKKMPCPHCPVIHELVSDKEPNNLEFILWEIKARLHIYQCTAKKPLLKIRFVLPLFLILAAPASASDQYVMTTEWHESSWVQGGYEDRDTIVTAKPAAPKEIKQKARKIPQAPTGYSILVPAGEPLQDIRVSRSEPLHGPKMGFNGPRWKVTSYAGSQHFETKSLMPAQVRYE